MQREALAEASGAEIRLVSGVSGQGVRELLREAYALVRRRKGEVSEAGEETEGSWTP
jgi:GTPase